MKTATPEGPGAGLSSRKPSARDRRLDFVDRLAARLISLGGVAIVLSVIAIVLFVGAGALPLLKGADSQREGIYPSPAGIRPLLLLSDEYLERRVLFGDDGLMYQGPFAASAANPTIDTVVTAGPLTCAGTDIFERIVALGDHQGTVHLFLADWDVHYETTGRTTRFGLDPLARVRMFESTDAVERVFCARNEDGAVFALGQAVSGRLAVYAFDPEWGDETTAELPRPEGVRSGVAAISLNAGGVRAVTGAEDGSVVVYDLSDPESPVVSQIIQSDDRPVTAVRYLLGGGSLVIGRSDGHVARWLPVLRDGRSERLYQQIDEFGSHTRAIERIVTSRRDKSFLTLDRAGGWQLHHATSRQTYYTFDQPEEPVSLLALAPRGNGIIATYPGGRSAVWRLENPHPEATAGTLLGKVWYEGFNEPQFVWQSTGGTDEFEPKLSLIPLIFGTLKGTLYSMLFSIPVALLAAIYVSQLARPGFRATVKPLIELMAAIPSVVVGFLAALWLAPMIERHLVGTGLALLSIPLSALAAAASWHILPWAWREKMPEGIEPFVGLPFIVGGIALALAVAPGIEALFFGGDARQWLFSDLGIRYDPRNNIVVGFALGVAVIPIIFTVSEDALSNVPTSLVSGALALGASRWQATWRIVLRAASPGIFAAIMLGFGRAVGETMIVLMATGNTPILDWSIFNGMRTMSATIAVEIPEAPLGGTLYRVLFLMAFLLFIFTLLVNTVAGMVGTRLRRRYGRF